MKRTELTPYAYKPFTTPLTRHILDCGEIEYRHTNTGEKMDVDTENLFDMILNTHEQIYTMVDLLPEEVFLKCGHVFMALLQNVSATMAEAQHFIKAAGVEIKVSTIHRNMLLFRDGAVVDAMVEGVEHAD